VTSTVSRDPCLTWLSPFAIAQTDFTALHYAARTNAKDAAAELIRAGADLESRTSGLVRRRKHE
jgi:hypothetical protein